tara:strand:- start:18176 stop:20122 length:1947 start_codon:yes stop_codon:yes gene_type:complete
MSRLLNYCPFLILFAVWLAFLLGDRTNMCLLVINTSVVMLLAIMVVWRQAFMRMVWPVTGLSVFVLLFLIYNFCSLVWTHIPTLSVYQVLLLSVFPLSFMIVSLVKPSETQWLWMLSAVVLVAVIEAISAVIQYWYFKRVPSGTFTNQNMLAVLLNLAMLPLVVKLLQPQVKLRWLFYIVVSLLFYTICLIASRGGLLACGIGLAVMFVALYRDTSWQKLAAVFALFVVIFAVGYPPLSHYILFTIISWFEPQSVAVTFSMASIGHVDPALSDSYRKLLWTSTWHIIQHYTWLGAGFNSFTYLLPQFRSPLENSAGYYAHNDYLQYWVAGGLPSFLILIGLVLAVLVLVYRITYKQQDRRVRFEGVAVAAASIAVFAHAVVSFPLFLADILMVLGVWLARLQQVAGKNGQLKQWNIVMREHVSARGVNLLFGFLTFAVLLNFAAMITTFTLSNRADQMLAKGDMSQAGRYAYIMQTVQPNYVAGYNLQAITLLTVAGNQDISTANRTLALRQGEVILEHVRRLNPWSPMPITLKAEMLMSYMNNKPNQQQQKQLQDLYREALRLNPRSYDTRVSYANYYIRLGQYQQAYDVLKKGLSYQFTATLGLLRCLKLYGEVAEKLGHHKEAQAINKLKQFFAIALQPGAKVTH